MYVQIKYTPVFALQECIFQKVVKPEEVLWSLEEWNHLNQEKFWILFELFIRTIS